MKKLFLYLSVFVFSTAAVAQCDSSSWVNYNTSNSGLINNQVNMIVVDDYDILWAGQGTGNPPSPSGLSRFDGVNWSYYNETNSALPADAIYSLCPDDSGNIWVGTGLGLAMFNGLTWTVYTTGNSGIISDVAFTLAIDLNGKLWIGTPDGVSVFDGSAWTIYTVSNSPLAYNIIRTIEVDHLNNVWIGTENGLSKYNQTSNSWTLYNTSNSGIPSNSLSSVEEDHNGNIWLGFGLGFHGVVEFDGLTWNYHYPFSDSLYTWVSGNSIHVDLFNNIWVGSRCEGLFYYNGVQWTQCTPSIPPPSFNCSGINYSMAFDNDNHVWYAEVYSGVWTTAIPNGIQEENPKNGIEIYPNPAIDQLTIISNQLSGKAEVEIYNILGERVYKSEIRDQKTQINISALRSGVYFVEVRDEKNILRKKFVKE